jgi:glycosyltransferase involved in cell wall biosynthesis
MRTNNTAGEHICIIPRLQGVGGPASFEKRLIKGLNERGISTIHNLDDPACTGILVIGGTNQLFQMWRARQRGVRIVQRLNGMNWIHRKRSTPFIEYWRAERANWLLSFIRRYLSDHIVYQSEFARDWWHTIRGPVRVRNSVIYNGVDTQAFALDGQERPPQNAIRILLVEGHLAESNQQGLENGVHLVQMLDQRMGLPVKLMVVGEVSLSLKTRWQAEAGHWIEWVGVVQGEQIPQLNRSAHLLFSADLNAACPNSVIEALACGLPVVAFSTGSLPELLEEDAGRVVPYGSNFWNLESPDISPLANAAQEMLSDLPYFQKKARQRAVSSFSLEKMVNRYLDVLTNKS